MHSWRKISGFTALCCLVGLLSLLPASRARAAGDMVVARARIVNTTLHAFARVEPLALIRLKAAQEGTVSGLAILPGERLKSGAVLGHLGGPAPEALLAREQSAVAGARAKRIAAHRILAAAREKQAAHLATREAVYRAEAALAGAQARLDAARAQLAATKELLTLRAPSDGTVLSVAAAAGERVAPGQTLLTLQPRGGLWLKAAIYGTDATTVRVGMTGPFTPAGGGAAIPVRVRSIIGTTTPGGGLTVGLKAARPSPGWHSGEAGSVTLEGAPRTLVAVPTRALILDRGRWWVLVRTKKGIRPQAVVPGVSRGTSTLIERGLAPGSRIVVENAYLEFHRNVSRHYQPPD